MAHDTASLVNGPARRSWHLPVRAEPAGPGLGAAPEQSAHGRRFSGEASSGSALPSTTGSVWKMRNMRAAPKALARPLQSWAQCWARVMERVMQTLRVTWARPAWLSG